MADENKNQEMTIDQLKTLINESIVKEGKAQTVALIDEFKKEGLKTEMKKIFPKFDEEGNFNGGQVATKTKSVLDLSCLRKNYQQNDREYAESLLSIGGPFKKLSPAMEAWGGLLKCTKNHNALLRYDYPKLEALCKEQMKLYGIKDDSIGNTMSEENLTNGSYLVPIEFPSIVIEAAVRESPVLKNIWRLPMNGPLVSLPRLTQSDGSYFGGVTFQYPGGVQYSGGVVSNTGEGVLISPTQAAIGRIMLQAQKVVAGVVLTDEIIQDSIINIVNYMTGLLVKAWQYQLEYLVINGGGLASGQPLGILQDTAVQAAAVPRITANQVGYQDLLNLEGAMDEIFAGKEFWLLRRKTLNSLRGQVDTVKQPLVKETWGERMGIPTMTPTILTHPYWVTHNMPALGSAGDMLIGDFGMYILGVRSDMRIDISDAPRFEYDETNVRFVTRLDGKPGTDFAFKMLSANLS
jgi:HK97 family phage major capsid protein